MNSDKEILPQYPLEKLKNPVLNLWRDFKEMAEQYIQLDDGQREEILKEWESLGAHDPRINLLIQFVTYNITSLLNKKSPIELETLLMKLLNNGVKNILIRMLLEQQMTKSLPYEPTNLDIETLKKALPSETFPELYPEAAEKKEEILLFTEGDMDWQDLVEILKEKHQKVSANREETDIVEAWLTLMQINGEMSVHNDLTIEALLSIGIDPREFSK